MDWRWELLLLNLICFLCAINTTISYGFNATKASLVVSDVTTLITFVCVLYSLVILNHNTIIRATNLGTSLRIDRRKVHKYCRILYVLPLFVLIPIYYAFADKSGTGTAMNTSTFNLLIYKPVNIALLFATESFATVTDVLLLLKVKAASDALDASTTSFNGPPVEDSSVAGFHTRMDGSGVLQKSRKFQLASRDLWMNYTITWTLILIDATLKILIALGLPLLFDSIITITTVAMRSRTNLQYGLELQAMVSPDSRSVSNIAYARQPSGSTLYLAQPAGYAPPPNPLQNRRTP